MKLGEAYVEIKSDMKKIQSDLKKLKTSIDKDTKENQKRFDSLNFRRASSSIKKFTRHLFSLKTLVLSIGFYKVGQSFISTAASFEQMGLKLEALTKGKGKETLDALNQWAIKMPVNTQKAVDTFAMMMAMGLNPTIEKMETLVDVSILFGEEAMPRVARALGQMQTLGKLSAEELNQLSESGINARKYLSEAFGGKTVEEIQKSKIAIEEIIAAIMKGLDEDFGGSARRAMNTWQGVKAEFESTITEIERQFAGAGVFDALKELIHSISTDLNDWLKTQKELKNMGLPNWFDQVATSASKLADALGTIAKYAGLRSIMGTVGQAAELANQGRLGISMKDFLEKGFFERQELVDKILATTRAPGQKWRGAIPPKPSTTPGGGTPPSSSRSSYEGKGLKEFFSADQINKINRMGDAFGYTTAQVAEAKLLISDMTRGENEKLKKSLDEIRDKYEGVFGYTTAQVAEAKLLISDLGEKTEETFSGQMKNAIMDWSNNWSFALNEMLWGANMTFGEILKSFAKMITQMIIQKKFVEPLFSSIFNILPFAKGGVLSGPTVFPMANGYGFAGEAGYEGILPLKRNPQGELGVTVSGGKGKRSSGILNVASINTSKQNNVRTASKNVNIIMNNPTFQDMATQKKTLAQMVTIIASQVAPGAVVNSYNNDGKIRNIIRKGH